MHDEMLDIVDDQDIVIGQKLKSLIYADKKDYLIRVVNAFLINDQGELWIPRRTAHKKLFPLCLDASMGGHVMSGETYDQAFKRELQEELALDADTIEYTCVGKLSPMQHDTSAFMYVYCIRTNQVPQFNTDDFSHYMWIKPDLLLSKIEQGEPAKGDLKKMVHYLQSCTLF
ncbi:NUDIX domain-containing protein [Candidatus Babeliales bacterium]|nr:NUDIX domain-containing protein [Candidatus Babeliales bacterium]